MSSTTTTVPLTSFLYACGIAFLVMGVLDAIWLGWLAKDFYKQELGPLMADPIRVVPAALYYLLYPVAIVFLALSPPPATLGAAAFRSAVLGLTAFGIYDMTNLSTLKGYSVRLALVDTAWGTFATTLGGTAAYAFVIGRFASH